MKECFLCHRRDRTEVHHLFGGIGRRKKSDRLGLVVDLCPECHRHIHSNKDAMQYLHEYGQRRAMRDNNWTTEDFIREFGKSYI